MGLVIAIFYMFLAIPLFINMHSDFALTCTLFKGRCKKKKDDEDDDEDDDLKAVQQNEPIRAYREQESIESAQGSVQMEIIGEVRCISIYNTIQYSYFFYFYIDKS